MSYGDFVRQLPGASTDLARRPGLLQRFHIDLPLLLLLLLLTAVGLTVLYSASGQSEWAVQRQGRYFALAYVLMLCIAQLDVDRIRRLAPWGFALGVGLLLLVLLVGVGAKGAQRWLSLGGFRFQPAELMKLAVPMAVAWYLSARALPPRLRHVLVSLALIAVPALLIAAQPDLGTSILIAASGLAVLFLAGLPWLYIGAALLLGLASLWPLWQFGLHDYQRQRVLTLLNPESDRLGAGWNIIQSKTAIGSGGLEGKGWLSGTQSHLNFLPESHTDFIIAVLAEEFGLRGVLALLGLYLLIIGRAALLALRARDSFGRLLAGSVALTFFVYVFVNMGMVAGLLPVVGIPLPLVSQGGTSLLTLLLGFGLVMAIGTDQRMRMR